MGRGVPRRGLRRRARRSLRSAPSRHRYRRRVLAAEQERTAASESENEAKTLSRERPADRRLAHRPNRHSASDSRRRLQRRISLSRLFGWASVRALLLWDFNNDPLTGSLQLGSFFRGDTSAVISTTCAHLVRDCAGTVLVIPSHRHLALSRASA